MNVLANPGFEEEVADTWQVSNDFGAQGSWTLSGDVKRSGKYSIRLSKTNGLGYVRLASKQPVRVEAGATYTLRFWFYSANAQVSSFLIPRIVTGADTTAVTNPHPALWVHYAYDSQSLMRNAPSSAPEDWVKRIVFYENKTEQPQDVFIQVVLYGNPFDVYMDDFEFTPGKWKGQDEPASPGYNYAEEQVLEILSQRSEETARVSAQDGVTHFHLNGQEAWPVFYRGLLWKKDEIGNSIQDPAGFAAQGVAINNVFFRLSHYWTGPGEYNWENLRSDLMDTLRKNPQAKLLLDFAMDVYPAWKEEYPDDVWETADGKKIDAVSYSSRQWRQDGAEAIRHLVRDMKRHGFWKIVVGANIVGGHDGQFWTKVIGEYAADYAPGNRRAWQAWLRERHGDIGALNSAWLSHYADFSAIPIPDPTTGHETYPAIMPRGAVPDFRQFCEATAFDLRECFARAVKEEAGKDVFVSAYGMPHENQHECFLKMAGQKGKANDLIASMSYYPYRQPGFPSGYHPEQSFGYHNVGFMQELDLRSYASDTGWYDELVLMWVGSQPNVQHWRHMHRKLVGVSLAQNQGFWYYDMDKQFVDQDVLDEVGVVKKIADRLVGRKGVEFRPDVCLVRFGAESRYYGSSVDSAVGATVQWQYMLLETSGVPYDVHYLMDIMAEPLLQQYKVYIFHNHTFLSAGERAWINENLKKDHRILIWMYDSGYVTEQGVSTQALSALVGMAIGTEDGYTRSVVQIVGDDRLAGGAAGYLPVPPFQGMAEALCAIFTTHGPASLEKPFTTPWHYLAVPGVSRYQRFWIDGGFDAVLGTYVEDGKAALAVKRFADWTSVYIGAPNALAGEMMNNIAREAGAYRCGPAAMGEIRMSGRFVSYHVLKSGKYEFRLPQGASKMIDAETGRVLAEGVRSHTIDGVAQSTYWFFIE